MNKGRLVVGAVLWTTSLLGVALWAQQHVSEGTQEIRPGQPYGPVLSGENIGFRRLHIPNNQEEAVTGRLVVRINGEWLVATSPVSFRSMPIHR